MSACEHVKNYGCESPFTRMHVSSTRQEPSVWGMRPGVSNPGENSGSGSGSVGAPEELAQPPAIRERCWYPYGAKDGNRRPGAAQENGALFPRLRFGSILHHAYYHYNVLSHFKGHRRSFVFSPPSFSCQTPDSRMYGLRWQEALRPTPAQGAREQGHPTQYGPRNKSPSARRSR